VKINLPRIKTILYIAYGVLGLLLLITTAGVALSGTSLFRLINPVAGWVMVLLPSSPWMLLWFTVTVGGFSRWGRIRLLMAALSPILLWQGICSLSQTVDSWVPLPADHIWQGVRGVLEILLAIAGALGLVSWLLDRRARAHPSESAPPQ
jgi:hypothetical protein